jgi:membrane peptidoglycan carboxypeptidase
VDLLFDGPTNADPAKQNEIVENWITLGVDVIEAGIPIASDGDYKQPHLLKDAPSVGQKHVELSENTVEQVTQGMYGVVNEAGGTGQSVKLQGIEFCGKSGTAQMMSYAAASRLGLGKGKNDGWFVGFAPRRNPEIVVAAVVNVDMTKAVRFPDDASVTTTALVGDAIPVGIALRFIATREMRKMRATVSSTAHPGDFLPRTVARDYVQQQHRSESGVGGPSRTGIKIDKVIESVALTG